MRARDEGKAEDSQLRSPSSPSNEPASAGRTLDFNLALEVRVVEQLERDLVHAVVLGLELGVLDVEVLLDGLAWHDDVRADGPTDLGHDVPVGGGDGEAGQEEEQDIVDLEREVGRPEELCEQVRHDDDEGRKVVVAERSGAYREPGSAPARAKVEPGERAYRQREASGSR